MIGDPSAINLEDIHSPCTQCYFQGHLYSQNDDSCKKCEYNISMQILKQILYCTDGCSLCKNRERLGGGYWDCKINHEDICKGNDLVVDWKAVISEYCQ